MAAVFDRSIISDIPRRAVAFQLEGLRLYRQDADYPGNGKKVFSQDDIIKLFRTNLQFHP